MIRLFQLVMLHMCKGVVKRVIVQSGSILLLGIRGQLHVIVKVDLFTDSNKFRQSSCGVRFFCSKLSVSVFVLFVTVMCWCVTSVEVKCTKFSYHCYIAFEINFYWLWLS